MTDELPPRLQEIVDSFVDAPKDLRLEVLLEFSKAFPSLPEAYVGRTDLERVEECQTPLFLATELDAEGRVHLVFDAPKEAPTTRGFASILFHGIDGETPAVIAALPEDLPSRFGLMEVVSPLRLRGFSALLGRVKRQVRELVA
ncbi:MAG: SufE family protein [Actinomycetota bacterium]